MDLATYAILLAGALAGGFVSGLAGFGTALMALGIWLYVLPPAIAVPLVLICSVSRADLDAAVDVEAASTSSWLWPFVVGGLAGMPIGALLVARADPQVFQAQRRRDAAGVSDRALFHPHSRWPFASAAASPTPAIGFAGGILGGLAGLSGPLPTLWASVRGWTRISAAAFSRSSTAPCSAPRCCLQIATGFVKLNVVPGWRCWRCPAR